MPCLNEAETIAACIGKAMTFLRANDIAGDTTEARVKSALKLLSRHV